MQTLSSGVFADLLGKFLVDSIYSELLSLSPELAADVMSLSGSAGIPGVAFGTYVGHALIEFILPLLMAADVAVSLAVVFGDRVSREGGTGASR